MKAFALNILHEGGKKEFKDFDTIKTLTQFKRRLKASSHVKGQFQITNGTAENFVVLGTTIITKTKLTLLAIEMNKQVQQIWHAEKPTLFEAPEPSKVKSSPAKKGTKSNQPGKKLPPAKKQVSSKKKKLSKKKSNIA